jgi:hypothetical protein
MKLHRGKIGLSATGLLSAAAAAAVFAATPASAATFSNTFEVSYPYWQNTSSVGKFTAQVTYVDSGTKENPITFSLTMSAATQAAATGTMTCAAYQFNSAGNPTGTSDYHPNEPIDYIWHWTVPTNPIGSYFQEQASCYFPIKGGSEQVEAILNYVVDDGGGDARPATTPAGPVLIEHFIPNAS